MGLFNSIVSAVTNPTNLLALATMNPAIIAATLGRQIVSAIGQEVIQQVGSELGLPQSAIDMAQGAFASSMGDVQGAQQNYQEALDAFMDEFNASPLTRGNVDRQIDAFRSMAFQFANMFLEENEENMRSTNSTGPRSRGGAQGSGSQGVAGAQGGVAGAASNADGITGVGTSGGESILMKIAKALGEAMDDKMERMAQKADDLGNLGEVDENNQSQYGEMSAELTALGQELKILQEALNNTLKSIGEATSGLARKQ